MIRYIFVALAVLFVCISCATDPGPPPTFQAGTRVGIVNSVEPYLTHRHITVRRINSFTGQIEVDWNIPGYLDAQLNAAVKALDDLQLNAPFDGTVSELYLKENEWIAPGQPVLLLADLENLRVETTDLNEIDVARIEVGDTAIVTFDALPGLAVEGKVMRVAQKAAEGSGVNYTVVILLDEIPEKLRWGMTAFVDIEVE